MPKALHCPERLFDRTWRPGHPFRPRLSGGRRWGMVAIFVLLCAIIGGYIFLTDSRRVRTIAEQYLSQILGGHVTIGKATLSIFEGLTLENVQVEVGEPNAPPSQLFFASKFILEYSPRALLRGRIDARRIVAISPRVTLTENLETRDWNFKQLKPRGGTTAPVKGPMPAFPEIALRDAEVVYNQLQNGQLTPSGTINIEGVIAPDADAGVYRFRFQSRGKSQAMGPSIDGTVAMNSLKIKAQLHRVDFGPDVQVMLPDQVRRFWKDHGLEGSGIKLADISYDWRNRNGEFDVNIQLEDVQLKVPPRDLLGSDEMQRREKLIEDLEALKSGPVPIGDFSALANALKPRDIAMSKVSGSFSFTRERIDLHDVQVFVAGNHFQINGRIDGYSPDATAMLDLKSVGAFTIPASPPYIASMPAAIREIHHNFRPQGTGSVWVKCERLAANEPPHVNAEITIHDGQFTFDKFPYPVHKASGKIAIDRDPETGQERLRFVNLHGHGIAGGPNEKCSVEINGEMGPFNPAMSVRVTVKGENIRSEPALSNAFPARTRQALRLFDSAGKGEFPKYSGSFVCEIVRFPERKSRWSVLTEINLDDAAGSLVAFPYPMSGLRGRIRIMDDHLEIDSVSMKRGESTLDVSGRVDWRSPVPSDTASEDPRAPIKDPGARSAPAMRPTLKLSARNVPIDDDLFNALPAQEREWLKKLGASGRFDLDGMLTGKQRTAGGSDVDFAFDVGLHGCALGAGSAPLVSSIDAQLKLSPQQMEIEKLTGHRGEAVVNASGAIRWPTQPPTIDIVAQADNLALDQSLYDLLSEPAKRGWDQVRPQGTVDARIVYKSHAGPTTAPTTASTEAANAYEVTIAPRSLTATPLAAPYRLEQLAGTATITPGKVMLTDITARHGDANVRLSGSGTLGAGGAWTFHLAGDHMLVDDDLRRAVPSVLQNLLRSSQAQGQIGFEFSKLSIEPSTNREEAAVDIGFDVRLWAENASLNVGVPLSKVIGQAQISGQTRGSKLAALSGSFDVPALTIADRAATNFRADIAKRPESQAMTLYNMQAQLAGGAMAGQIDWISPDNSPARYAMSINLRDADMRELSADPTPELRGQASASLALEGNWDDPNSRRGGGDVIVKGDNMYKIPIVLGLLQITNLALPTANPFNEANCRYSIDAGRVTFETIELRSKEMLMQGNGHLDFATRQVRLDFITAAQNWPKIPIIGDLLQGARNELLTIHVRGTLQEPKVSASSMSTLTTTVDEVFKGTPPPEDTVKKQKK